MNYDERIQTEPLCTASRTAEIIGGKWTTLILREFLSGTKRFGEVRASPTGMSPKTPTDRLRDLESRQILERTIYAEVPPRVEYALIERGEDLRLS